MSTEKREFAKNLKREMKRRGLTPPKLVDETGLKERTIERWLEAKSIPQSANLKKLADALGIPPEALNPELQIRPDAIERIEFKLNRLLENAGLPVESLDDIHRGVEEELGDNGEQKRQQSG